MPPASASLGRHLFVTFLTLLGSVLIVAGLVLRRFYAGPIVDLPIASFNFLRDIFGTHWTHLQEAPHGGVVFSVSSRLRCFGFARCNLFYDFSPMRALCNFQIVGLLQVEPAFRVAAKVACQAHRGIG